MSSSLASGWAVDIDLVVAVDLEIATKAGECLLALGLKPKAPVNPKHSTPTSRHQWLEETLQLLWRNGFLKDKLKEREADS